jgi:hypothetical protein
VYFDGMLPPSVNAALEIVNAAVAINAPSIKPPFTQQSPISNK